MTTLPCSFSDRGKETAHTFVLLCELTLKSKFATKMYVRKNILYEDFEIIYSILEILWVK